MGSSGCTGFGVTAAPAARRLSSAAFCISKVLIVICTKPVFIVSQVSTVLSSLIFFSISSTFAVGVIMPGNGNDSGFHAFCMNSKKSLGKSCSGTASSVNATVQLYHKPTQLALELQLGKLLTGAVLVLAQHLMQPLAFSKHLL